MSGGRAAEEKKILLLLLLKIKGVLVRNRTVVFCEFKKSRCKRLGSSDTDTTNLVLYEISRAPSNASI